MLSAVKFMVVTMCFSFDWEPSSYVESYTRRWGSCGTWCTHNCGSLAILIKINKSYIIFFSYLININKVI